MKRFAYTALLLLVAFALPAQDGQLELSIRYYDKAIYFTESTVQIKLEFFNNGATPVRFNLAENRVFSFDFEVRSTTNIAAELAQTFVIARGEDSPIFYREISLGPGERFGFVTRLDDFIQMPGPGEHVVRGFFYPELYRSNTSVRIVSNALALTIHPGSVERLEAVAMELESGEMISRAALPPDEVVSTMLTSRQTENWDSFFLYLDLERLYTRTSAREEEYLRLSDAARRRTIERYRSSLEARTTEDDILLIPAAFEIERTSYTSDDASVVVTQRFAYSGFTEIKEYTYYLARRDRVWMIYDYAVRNLGTE